MFGKFTRYSLLLACYVYNWYLETVTDIALEEKAMTD